MTLAPMGSHCWLAVWIQTIGRTGGAGAGVRAAALVASRTLPRSARILVGWYACGSLFWVVGQPRAEQHAGEQYARRGGEQCRGGPLGVDQPSGEGRAG